MLKPADQQRSFYDTDQVCESLIPPDSFYRKFREVVAPLITDEQFAALYCPDNGRPGPLRGRPEGDSHRACERRIPP